VLRNNSWRLKKHDEKENKNTKRMNAEHGEEYTSESACLCTQMSGSNLSEGTSCG